MLWTATGTRSVTAGSPNGVTAQLVRSTASFSSTFTGGHERLKSKVNSYTLGEQAHISLPISWLTIPDGPASKMPNEASRYFIVGMVNNDLYQDGGDVTV